MKVRNFALSQGLKFSREPGFTALRDSCFVMYDINTIVQLCCRQFGIGGKPC